MKNKWISFSICMLSLLMLASCRGYRSEKPPYHMNPNFDWQSKFKAQTYSQAPVKGTVAYGRSTQPSKMEALALRKNDTSVIATGRLASGRFARRIPSELGIHRKLKRGQERYNIYCVPCHDLAGDGKGTVIERGFTMPPSFHSERVLSMREGYLYDVIANGVRNMPGYGKQIEIEDRWAIVAYLRALQKTRTTTIQEAKKYHNGRLPE